MSIDYTYTVALGVEVPLEEIFDIRWTQTPSCHCAADRKGTGRFCASCGRKIETKTHEVRSFKRSFKDAIDAEGEDWIWDGLHNGDLFDPEKDGPRLLFFSDMTGNELLLVCVVLGRFFHPHEPFRRKRDFPRTGTDLFREWASENGIKTKGEIRLWLIAEAR